MNRCENRSYDDDNRSVSSEIPSKNFECPECSKSFSSRYSRDRHVSNFHECEEESDMNPDDENPSDEDESMSDEDENMSDENEEELEQESDNEDTSPFNDLVCLTYEHHSKEREAIIEHLIDEDDLTEEEAKMQADSILLPKMKKSLKMAFTNYIIGMTEKRNTSLMKAILKKAREYTKDGFGERAAIEAAVSYRKHMIYELLGQDS